jgi:succinylglutamate desuccinylase/aspartoacylase family protein
MSASRPDVHRVHPDVRRARIEIREAPRGEAAGASVEDFLAWLGGPSLLRIAGRDRARTRALATLLHGNEPSGVRALHAYLRGDRTPATDVVCFLGAVDAARAGSGFAHRMAPGRRDLNRCFREPFAGDEGQLAHEALRLLREANPDALVDLHNNTGHNPVYGVGTVADAASLNLTGFFGERFVVSDLRLGALVEATANDFPSVTIECGRAGDRAADAAALRGLEAYLALEALETRRVVASPIAILCDPVRVAVRPGVRLAFGAAPVDGVDLTLSADIDRHNFAPVMPGAPVGWLAAEAAWPLEARGADGVDLSRDLFVARDGRLETRRGMIPIMMTTDVAAALADCLFYVVQPREEIARR